uniref:Uncharacterized protein n=1 Tax=Candidatus Methanogaster sp. ANME-2c ERB4 TaxID=2759911 RepID=A0A7G9YQF4_9EURY|nr:hypothetical protein LCEAEILH_00004 [Methanosarcinales archaeon ANME-2c ERB4]
MDVKEAFNKFSAVLSEDEIKKSWRENMAWKTNVKGNCSLFLFLANVTISDKIGSVGMPI